MQTIEKLMMDCIIQQLHILKKLEFDGNQSDSLRSLRYTITKYMEMVASESYYTCEL